MFYINIKYTSICMYERNKYLVEHTDYLLAVYDGISKGGTAQTVRFSQKKGIPITIIHPNTLLVKSMIEPKTTQKAKVFLFL